MISEYIENHREEMLSVIKELVEIPSVMGEAAENAPFGAECARAVDKGAKILSRYGFRVKTVGNALAVGDIGEGEPQLGILAHLDVVPAGNGWNYPPFEMTERDGKIYGRGVIDDKGPAAAAIFGVLAAAECAPLNGVRIILGSNEENGSDDLKIYHKHEKMPPQVFTPDGSFPVINIEKGRLAVSFSADCPDNIVKSINAGVATNAVPDLAECVIAGDIPISGFFANGAEIVSEKIGSDTKITVKGKSAHASLPEGGVNAFTALTEILKTILPASPLREKLTLLSKRFPHGDTAGKGMGIDCADEKSGALTMIWSVCRYDGKTLSGGIDCRFPLCENVADLSGKVRQALDGFDLNIGGVEPHVVDGDGEFVKTLLSVYEKYTGEEGRCIAIGGGTYVHGMSGGVAFGAEFEGDENNMHGADENVSVERLLLCAKIYGEAVLRLCRR